MAPRFPEIDVPLLQSPKTGADSDEPPLIEKLRFSPPLVPGAVGICAEFDALAKARQSLVVYSISKSGLPVPIDSSVVRCGMAQCAGGSILMYPIPAKPPVPKNMSMEENPEITAVQAPHFTGVERQDLPLVKELLARRWETKAPRDRMPEDALCPGVATESRENNFWSSKETPPSTLPLMKEPNSTNDTNICKPIRRCSAWKRADSGHSIPSQRSM